MKIHQNDRLKCISVVCISNEYLHPSEGGNFSSVGNMLVLRLFNPHGAQLHPIQEASTPASLVKVLSVNRYVSRILQCSLMPHDLKTEQNNSQDYWYVW